MRRGWELLAFGIVLALGVMGGVVASADDQPLRSGIDRANFDTSVKPGDDFFEYVNGDWIKNNPIPPEYSRWGAFPKLRDDNLLRAPGDRRGSRDRRPQTLDPDEQQDSRFLCDGDGRGEARSEQGAAPLKPELERIAKIETATTLVAEIGRLHATGASRRCSRFGVGQDEKQSDRYAVHLQQGGLGLPERDYYLGTTEDSQRHSRRNIASTWRRCWRCSAMRPTRRRPGPTRSWRSRRKLAEASRTPVQLRDREAKYNKKTRRRSWRR